MSDIADRLKQRFAGLRVRYVVPELDGVIPNDSQGEPAIYADPFTLADMQRINRFIENDSPEGYAQVFVMKALNENGERIFDQGDKATVMQCIEGHIVSRVAQHLMASVDLDDPEGN